MGINYISALVFEINVKQKYLADREHALQDILEVGEGLDVVELGALDERGEGGPCPCTAVGAGEEMVFAAERDWADGALDGVGIDLDAAVIDGEVERKTLQWIVFPPND